MSKKDMLLSFQTPPKSGYYNVSIKRMGGHANELYYYDKSTNRWFKNSNISEMGNEVDSFSIYSWRE